jgi:hypothetical protein
MQLLGAYDLLLMLRRIQTLAAKKRLSPRTGSASMLSVRLLARKSSADDRSIIQTGLVEQANLTHRCIMLGYDFWMQCREIVKEDDDSNADDG